MTLTLTLTRASAAACLLLATACALPPALAQAPTPRDPAEAADPAASSGPPAAASVAEPRRITWPVDVDAMSLSRWRIPATAQPRPVFAEAMRADCH